MKQILFFLLLITIISGCKKENCNCQIENNVLIQNDSLINSMINQPRNGYQNYWNRFEEPLINKQKKESYRLAIVVLLMDYFKIYRIENNKNQYYLHIKEYAVSTTTSFREDSLVTNYSEEISKKEWLDLTNSIKENCYWTMPVDIKEDDGWLDGSGWTLEGFNEQNICTDSKYHFIYRHSPYETNDTSNFISICEKFIALDSLNIREF